MFGRASRRRSAAVVGISPNDTPPQIRAKAATVTPSARQLAWQRLELTAFIHFGVNTYTAREHETGTEDPNVFQPNQLDTDQWKVGVYISSGKVMAVSGGSTAHGATIVQQTWTGAGSQRWELASAGGLTQLVNVGSGKVLDVPNLSTSPGTQLIQRTNNGGGNQQWQLVPV